MTIGITTGMMNTGIMSTTATGTVSEVTGVPTIISMNSSGSARLPSKKGTENRLVVPRPKHPAIPETPREQPLVRWLR